MRASNNNLVVGSVFLLGVSLVGVFTIVVKDITLLSGKEARLTVIFDRVAGLERGHKVLASGTEVGRVADLELREDGSVKVLMDLTKPLKLYKDYKIAVKDASALGGKFVDIEVGTRDIGVIPLSDMSSRSLDGRAQASLLDDPNLRESFTSLKKIAKDIEEGKGTVGLLITQRELYDDIRRTGENLSAITQQIRNTQGTIGKLLYDAELYEKVREILENVRTITDDIRQGKGSIGKLVKDDGLHQQLSDTLASAKKTMDNVSDITDKIKRGEGTVGKLVNDEKLHNQLDKALTDARRMMQEITTTARFLNQGKGTLATLLRDETLANDLRATVSSIRIVAERLKKGEGTVGKLLADETIYKELQRLVKSFSDSLEDTREQVPITTFTGLLFKAF